MDKIAKLLEYDPINGTFTWLENTSVKGSGAKRKGKSAGTYQNGTMVISLDRIRHSANRLAWFMMTGKEPSGRIIHKNGDKLDNRWENLEHMSVSEVIINAKTRFDNVSGIKNISKQVTKVGTYWNLQIHHKGKHKVSTTFPYTDEGLQQAIKRRDEILS